MRNSTLLLYAIAFFIFSISCDKSDTDLNSDSKDGFNLVINDTIIYNSTHINFYDFSSQLIYLKAGNSFSYSSYGAFSIWVGNEEIYTGQIVPGYSSMLFLGPVIHCAPTFYKDYIIPISFNQLTDNAGNSNDDPRYDTRIIEALKKFNQYKKGLSGEILSVQKLTDSKVKITIQLTNPDNDNLLLPDPDKMGLELFHYFTNGLIIIDSLNNTYSHHLTFEEPVPWDSWNIEWLTAINGDETKTISITYNDFDNIPSGQYIAWFTYPGLGIQIEREELQQDNGRIWLGQLNTSKLITIE